MLLMSGHNSHFHVSILLLYNLKSKASTPTRSYLSHLIFTTRRYHHHHAYHRNAASYPESRLPRRNLISSLDRNPPFFLSNIKMWANILDPIYIVDVRFTRYLCFFWRSFQMWRRLRAITTFHIRKPWKSILFSIDF